MAAAFDRCFRNAGQPRHIRRESRDDHAACAFIDHFLQHTPDISLRAGAAGVQNIGAVANNRINTGITELFQAFNLGQFANHRIGVNFPIAGMQNATAINLNRQSARLGNGVGQANIINREWPDIEMRVRGNNMQWHFFQKAGLSQLAAHQSSSERRCINGAMQARP